jgi:hypothetical protein
MITSYNGESCYLCLEFIVALDVKVSDVLGEMVENQPSIIPFVLCFKIRSAGSHMP